MYPGNFKSITHILHDISMFKNEFKKSTLNSNVVQLLVVWNYKNIVQWREMWVFIMCMMNSYSFGI